MNKFYYTNLVKDYKVLSKNSEVFVKLFDSFDGSFSSVLSSYIKDYRVVNEIDITDEDDSVKEYIEYLVPINLQDEWVQSFNVFTDPYVAHGFGPQKQEPVKPSVKPQKKIKQ